MRRLHAAFGLCGLACATSGVASGPAPSRSERGRAGSEVTLPGPAAADYVTDAGRNGIVGGPEAALLARTVADALRERGDQAAPDQTLAAIAAWYLQEVTAGREPSSPQSAKAAARLGFVGTLQTAAVFSLHGEQADIWRPALAQVARNIPITRYGVWVSPDGQLAALAFGAVELTLDPFPRHLAPGQSLRLHGEIGARYARAEVFLTAVNGTVAETGVPARQLDVSLPLPEAGIYRVEVMGDGPTGAVVLANVPIYVGVPESDANRPLAEGRPEVADAAARMLVLLNQARAVARLAPLVSDGELRAVALAYSQEMVAGHFFGHVSPITGTVGDRVRRAGVVVTLVGENISQGQSAESAHEGLMDSPGHRANMLDSRFTHVGIGVAETNGQPPLVATLVFGRRPVPARLTAAEVMEAVSALRRARGVGPVSADRVLQAAAEAGMAAFVAGAPPSREQAMTASTAALAREDRRLRIFRQGGCAQWVEILEVDDLKQLPLLTRPGIKKVGLAVTVLTTGQPPPLAVLVLVEGSGCDAP